MTDVCGALTCDVCGRSSWGTTITWYPGGAQRCAKHQLRQEGEEVAAVDQAIVERPDDAYGQGEITCPICQGIIDYRFKRGRRMLVRMKCRTNGCFVAMT